MAEQDYNEDSHPALKSFSRPLEYVKHVVWSSIKTAAKWALIGGLAMGVVGLIPGAAEGAVRSIPFVGEWLGKIFTDKTGWELVGAAAKEGLRIGAIAGLVGGGLSGIGSADDAVEDIRLNRIDEFERAQAREQNGIALELQRAGGRPAAQAQAPVSPGYVPGMQQAQGAVRDV